MITGKNNSLSEDPTPSEGEGQEEKQAVLDAIFNACDVNHNEELQLDFVINYIRQEMAHVKDNVQLEDLEVQLRHSSNNGTLCRNIFYNILSDWIDSFYAAVAATRTGVVGESPSSARILQPACLDNSDSSVAEQLDDLIRETGSSPGTPTCPKCEHVRQLQSLVSASEEHNANLNTENDNLRKEVEILKSKEKVLKKAEDEKKELLESLDTATTEIASLRNQNQKLLMKEAKLKKALKVLQQEKEALEDELESKTLSCQKLEEMVMDEKHRAWLLSQQLKEQVDIANELRTLESNLKDSLMNVEQEKKVLEKQLAAVKESSPSSGFHNVSIGDELDQDNNLQNIFLNELDPPAPEVHDSLKVELDACGIQAPPSSDSQRIQCFPDPHGNSAPFSSVKTGSSLHSEHHENIAAVTSILHCADRMVSKSVRDEIDEANNRQNVFLNDLNPPVRESDDSLKVEVDASGIQALHSLDSQRSENIPDPHAHSTPYHTQKTGRAPYSTSGNIAAITPIPHCAGPVVSESIGDDIDQDNSLKSIFLNKLDPPVPEVHVSLNAELDACGTQAPPALDSQKTQCSPESADSLPVAEFGFFGTTSAKGPCGTSTPYSSVKTPHSVHHENVPAVRPIPLCADRVEQADVRVTSTQDVVVSTPYEDCVGNDAIPAVAITEENALPSCSSVRLDIEDTNANENSVPCGNAESEPSGLQSSFFISCLHNPRFRPMRSVPNYAVDYETPRTHFMSDGLDNYRWLKSFTIERHRRRSSSADCEESSEWPDSDRSISQTNSRFLTHWFPILLVLLAILAVVIKSRFPEDSRPCRSIPFSWLTWKELLDPWIQLEYHNRPPPT